MACYLILHDEFTVVVTVCRSRLGGVDNKGPKCSKAKRGNKININ